MGRVHDPNVGFHGKVEHCGGSYVATRFASWFMPFFPKRSYLVVAEDHTGAPKQVIPVGLSWSSVVAAYARTWGVFACVALGVEQWYAGAALAVLLVYPWFLLGRLSVDERARRLAYAIHAKYPIDVATATEFAKPIRTNVGALVFERARLLASGTYRTMPNPSTHWGQIALDPTVTDVEYLAAAMTLARIEWSRERGARRRGFARAHDAIWPKLRSLRPDLVQSARSRRATSSSTDSSLAKQNRESVSPTGST